MTACRCPSIVLARFLDPISLHAIRPLRPLARAGAHSRQGDIPDLDILVAPLVEQLGRADLLGDILGQHRVALGRLNLDLGHFREFLLCKSLSSIRKTRLKGAGGRRCWLVRLRLEIRLTIVRASRTSAGECGCLGALKNLARQVCL